MKISAFWKSSLREIKQSFGRFVAIFGIVALGVSLFTGLKVTRDAMVVTAEKYFAEKEFYDFRLLSTLGFDDAGVEAIRSHEEVRDVQGSVSFDILYRSADGNDQVLKVHSLTDPINQVVVTAGRMPENDKECLVDDLLFTEEQIGQTVLLSPVNKDEDLEHFRYEEYTITGLCKSPSYIQFERGNSSLGSGVVVGFMYLPIEGFTTDYYTEVYVKLQEDMALYGEEYEAYVGRLTPEFEELARIAAENRYEELLADAQGELKDAKEELAEGEAEGLQELADAERELADAKQKLTEAETDLADGRKQLAEGKAELADAERELADAQVTIAEKAAELVDGQRAFEEGLQQWQENRQKLDEAGSDLEAKEAQLTEQRELLDAKEKELLQLELLLNSGMPGLPVTAEQIAAGKQEIAGARMLLEGYFAQINDGKAEIASVNQQLWQAYEELMDAQTQLIDGNAKLEEVRQELADGEQELAEGKAELADAEAELITGQQEYEDGKKEYEEGLTEYLEGKAEFDTEIADAKEKIADAEKEIADIAAPEIYCLGRDTNVGYMCFDNDSSIIDGIANVFPVFFFLVAALVCITTMNRMVEEQRTQIGVLKALGYSDAKIMNKYFFYAGTAAMTGCAVGYFGGSYIFPKVIWFAYGIMYRVDTLEYVLDPVLALVSVIASLAASVGATWWSCKSELTQVAAALIRPRAPQAGKRIFLEYVPFIWNRLGFLKKVSVRNIFRYKKRLFMMVFGISGCTALLVTGFGVKDSIVNVANQQFGEIQIYDIGIEYEESVLAEQQNVLEDRAGISSFLVLTQGAMDAVTEEVTKSVNMVVVPAATDITPFVNLHTEQGEPIPLPGRGEAVISHKLAENLNLQLGDTIVLRNEDMETIEAIVSGIHKNFVYSYVYLTADTYEDCMGRAPENKSAYVNAAEGTDLHQLAAELMGQDGVLSVNINDDMLHRLNSMMASFDMIVLVIILCAAGLAFIVLYNLTNINIMERIREIATIKVLGFYKNESRSYVFRENLILAAMGALAGLLLGKWFHAFVMSQVNIDLVSFDVQIFPVSYVYSVLLTLGFALFVSLVMGKKLDNISMTESLKSVD